MQNFLDNREVLPVLNRTASQIVACEYSRLSFTSLSLFVAGRE